MMRKLVALYCSHCNLKTTDISSPKICPRCSRVFEEIYKEVKEPEYV